MSNRDDMPQEYHQCRRLSAPCSKGKLHRHPVSHNITIPSATTESRGTANSHTASRQPAAALFLTRYPAPISYSTSAGKAVSVSWSRQRATPVGLKPEPHAHASGASSSLNTSCLWTLCTPRIFSIIQLSLSLLSYLYISVSCA